MSHQAISVVGDPFDGNILSASNTFCRRNPETFMRQIGAPDVVYGYDKEQLTCLFIAHDLSVVEFISDNIAVLYLGKIVELAPSEVLLRSHRHPYTKSLLLAIPLPDPTVEQNKPPFSLIGEVTSPINPPAGCRFSTRCPSKKDICEEKHPELVEIAKDHSIACFRMDRDV